ERVFGFRQATITSLSDPCSPCTHRPYTSASSTISTSHTSNWTSCAPGCAAPDRCSGSGWPSTLTRAILAALHLGPCTQHMAQRVIAALLPIFSTGCIPRFSSDGLNLSFSALTAHVGHWLQVGRRGRKVSPWHGAAQLIYGQVKQSYRRLKLVRVSPV